MWKKGADKMKNEVLNVGEKEEEMQHPYAFHVSGHRNASSPNWKDPINSSWYGPGLADLEDVDVDVEVEVEVEDYYYYEDEEDLDDVYYASSSSLRIGNRIWGDNGYVRGGWQEARPMHRPNSQDTGAGPSRQPKKKETAKEMVGRRVKRALKREAAAAKHERHLMRLGHKSG